MSEVRTPGDAYEDGPGWKNNSTLLDRRQCEWVIFGQELKFPTGSQMTDDRSFDHRSPDRRSQIAYHKSQVTGHRSQVTDYRSSIWLWGRGHLRLWRMNIGSICIMIKNYILSGLWSIWLFVFSVVVKKYICTFEFTEDTFCPIPLGRIGLYNVVKSASVVEMLCAIAVVHEGVIWCA